MKKAYSFLFILGAMVTTMSIVSCSKSTATVATPTLYDSLGGTAMVSDPTSTTTPKAQIEQGRLNIRSVVDSAIFVIAGDDSIKSYFSVLLAEVGSNNFTGFTALSNNLTDFFCVGTGAKDFSYTGKSMSAAHNPATNSRISMKVDSADFGEFVTDVVAGAHQNGLSTYQIGRLGAVIYSVEGQVVQR
jgi:hypothetical protein